ncbi:MAG: hypothetical protein KatS3mg105_1157 [Gemmatales bacterium]|nr:MAG: hypothetical protein KatS3mg105_1157 [Gemmatales bacterium]
MDVKTFVDQLRDCGLLFDRRLERGVRDLESKANDGKTLARLLIQQGLLTAYQANHILTGKGKELVLGQYRIVERLGQGSTGQTFKAVHATMGRLVVIRLMAPHLTNDPKSRTKFTREVQNIAQLSHTNILTAFDAFEVGGMYVLVMEYVEGMDLAALVRHVGPLPVQLACNFLRQTALGLQHAYERGLGFCNIKPENILIAGYQANQTSSDSSSSSAVPRGVVKILNLGLANLNEEAPLFVGGSPQLRSGAILSPADYMPPEMIRDSRSADIRSDIYRLGCILYFALTGRPPFPGKTIQEKLGYHQTHNPAPLEKVRPDVPPQLVPVVLKMMAKNPAARYQTPAELAHDLTPFCVTTPAGVSRA